MLNLIVVVDGTLQKENREVNAKAIKTIAKYSEKLGSIQSDINEIKTDITIINEKIS